MDIVIVMLAGFLSAVIKTGVGVGSGIFLLPLLSLVFPAKIALGLGAPIMLTSDLAGLPFYWRQWLPARDLLRLLLAAVPGLVLGILLLPLIPNGVFRVCVGLFGMLYSISLLWPGFPVAVMLRRLMAGLDARFGRAAQAEGDAAPAPNRFGAWFYGCLGGFSTVLAHAGGLVWSLYLVTAAGNRRIFVGTMVLMFSLTNIYKTVAYVWSDIISLETMLTALPAVPAIIAGSWVGNWLNNRCDTARFRKIVLCMIFAVSLSLCL